MVSTRAQKKREDSLDARPWDKYFYIPTMIIFALIAILLDFVNVSLPVGPFGDDPASRRVIPWPPTPFVSLIAFWCDLADPFLCTNPPWLRFLAVLSPFAYLPFWVHSALSLSRDGSCFTRWGSVRIGSLLVGAALVATVPPIVVETVWGDTPSPRPWLVFAAYGPYVMFPAMLIRRAVVGDAPEKSD